MHSGELASAIRATYRDVAVRGTHLAAARQLLASASAVAAADNAAAAGITGMVAVAGGQVVGGGSTGSEPVSAALATLTAWIDPDDPGWALPICAAAAAAINANPASDSTVAAILIGAEFANRIADALGPRHREVWDPRGSVGVLGAAITAVLAAGAACDETLGTAIGIAASMTGGLAQHRGTPLGALHGGLAAANGVFAARLAARGVTASPTAIDGPRGLLKAYGSDAGLASVVAGLGRRWTVLGAACAASGNAFGSTAVSRSSPADELADRLATLASSLRLDALPASTVHAGRRSLANVLGLAVAAAAHPATERVALAGGDLALSGAIRVLGRTHPTSAYGAALLHGFAMHVEDFDDTHLQTVLHPGAPATAAALAAAELTRASGAEVLAGVIAGIEVGSRVGLALGIGHFDRGWHVSGTVGHVAACASACRVLGLDAPTTRHALAIAATQAAGVTEQLGSMTKALHVGRAAAGGVLAAVLARAGVTGALPFAGRGGFADALSPSYDVAVGLAGLGATWEVEANTFKPYSCGIVSHPVIDAAVAAREQGIVACEIQRVVATVRPVVLEVMGVVDPGDGLQSKFSVYHCFAVGLLDGGAGPAQYSDERVTDADVVALRRRVVAETDPDMPKDACRVVIETVHGDRRVIVVEHASGSVVQPMTDAQLAAKFSLLVAPVVGAKASDDLWKLAMNLDQQPSLDALFAAAQCPPGGPTGG